MEMEISQTAVFKCLVCFRWKCSEDDWWRHRRRWHYKDAVAECGLPIRAVYTVQRNYSPVSWLDRQTDRPS